ncbi:hypothetical protein [Pseudorhodoferax soli]|uniref:Uncharacterized protein n=1 Tax=Pseudorhodoferax soli TaxID=545864 RepID=A0A368XF96_9BURK|nr:hypothetical protein [Pseudorhodoferax soli]RCW65167.1 hypothetical protein DES41_11391 [Pseudorhodoferax soli]
MTKAEARKGGGAKTSRSETVTVRLDPRLRYLAEVAAAVQRRTLSSYIESAVEASLSSVYLDHEHDVTVASSAKLLWFINEPARLARLNKLYPHLLDVAQQRLVRAAKEASILIGAALRRPGASEEDHAEEEAEALRPYWDYLKLASEDDTPMAEILSTVAAMKKEFETGGAVTLERIEKRMAELDAKHKKDMAWLEAKKQEVQAGAGA